MPQFNDANAKKKERSFELQARWQARPAANCCRAGCDRIPRGCGSRSDSMLRFWQNISLNTNPDSHRFKLSGFPFEFLQFTPQAFFYNLVNSIHSVSPQTSTSQKSRSHHGCAISSCLLNALPEKQRRRQAVTTTAQAPSYSARQQLSAGTARTAQAPSYSARQQLDANSVCG